MHGWMYVCVPSESLQYHAVTMYFSSSMLLYILSGLLSNPIKKTELTVIKQCWQWVVQDCIRHFQSSVIVVGKSDNNCCRGGATQTFAAAAQWWRLSAAGIHVLSAQVLPQLRMLLCILRGCHPNGLWWDDWWAQPRADQPQTLYIPLVGLEA